MEMDHLTFGLQMCIECQLVLGPEVCRASGEQSRLDHPEGGTEAACFLHPSHTPLPELSLHFLQLLLEPTSSWAARAKLESTLTPVWPQGTGLWNLPHLLAPLDDMSQPQSPGSWAHPILSQPSAQPTSPHTSRSPSSSSCHFTLRAAGDGTPSESGPDSSSLSTNQRAVFIVPPFSQRIHTNSLKPEP